MKSFEFFIVYCKVVVLYKCLREKVCGLYKMVLILFVICRYKLI